MPPHDLDRALLAARFHWGAGPVVARQPSAERQTGKQHTFLVRLIQIVADLHFTRRGCHARASFGAREQVSNPAAGAQ